MITLTSGLFLIGSLVFQLDAVLELREGLSFRVFLHLLAGTLFTIGLVLFVIHNAQQKGVSEERS